MDPKGKQGFAARFKVVRDTVQQKTGGPSSQKDDGGPGRKSAEGKAAEVPKSADRASTGPGGVALTPGQVAALRNLEEDSTEDHTPLNRRPRKTAQVPVGSEQTASKDKGESDANEVPPTPGFGPEDSEQVRSELPVYELPRAAGASSETPAAKRKRAEEEEPASEERIRSRQKTNKNSLLVNYNAKVPVYDNEHCSAMVHSQVAAGSRSMMYFRDLEFPGPYAEMARAAFLLASKENSLVMDYEEKIHLQAGEILKEERLRKKAEEELRERDEKLKNLEKLYDAEKKANSGLQRVVAGFTDQVRDLQKEKGDLESSLSEVRKELAEETGRLRESRSKGITEVRGLLVARFNAHLDQLKRRLEEKDRSDQVKAEKEQGEELLKCFGMLEEMGIPIPTVVRTGTEDCIRKCAEDLENLHFEPIAEELFDFEDGLSDDVVDEVGTPAGSKTGSGVGDPGVTATNSAH